jgi:predicted dehydrogenase
MLRIGIIGLRHPHIFSLQGDVAAVDGAVIVAVAEDEPSLQSKAGQLGVPIYRDYRQMIDKENLDAVGVCPVNSEKGRVICECLDSGLHVIADKPLLTTVEDLELVRRAWQRSGKHLLSMLTLRYDRPFLALRRFVDEGGLGEPVALFATGPHRLNLPTRYPWMLRDDLCGGIIVDLGCHYVDAMRWFSGRECRALAAVHGNKRFTQLEGFTSYAQVQMRLDGGVVGTVQVDWLSPDAAPYWGDMRFMMTGTKGSAEARTWPEPQALVATLDKPPFVLELPTESSSVGVDFLRAIIEGRDTGLSTEDCLEATRLTILARQAAESGTIVSA